MAERLEQQSQDRLKMAMAEQHKYYSEKVMWLKEQYENLIRIARDRADSEITSSKTLQSVYAKEREALLQRNYDEEVKRVTKELKGRVMEAEYEKEKLRITNTAMANSTAALLAEVDSAKATAAKAVAGHEAVMEEMRQWTKENARRLAELEELSEKYRGVLYECQEAKRETVAAKNDCLVSDETNKRLKASLNGVNQQLSKTEKALAEERDKVSTLRKDLQDLKLLYSNLEVSSKENEASVVSLTELLQSTKLSLVETTNKLEESKVAFKTAEDDALVLAKKVDTLQLELHNHHQQFRHLDNKYVETQMLMSSVLRSIETADKELEAAGVNVEKIDAHGKSKLSETERALMKLRGDIHGVVTKPTDNGGNAGGGENSQVIKVRKQLEKELRGRMEKDLEYTVKLEFMEKNASDLKVKIQREMNKAFALKLNNALNMERIKNRRGDSEWREACEVSEARLKIMEQQCRCGAFAEDGEVRKTHYYHFHQEQQMSASLLYTTTNFCVNY
jgi:hypothetical protein